MRAIPNVERRLLERSAPDSEIAALDVRRRRLSFQLDEIDVRENGLLGMIPGARRGERQGEWLSFVDAFETLAHRARDLAGKLAGVQNDVHALHIRAAQAGFNPHQSRFAMLPTIADARVDWGIFTSLPDRIPQLRQAISTPVERPILHALRFLRFAIVPIGFNQVGYPAGSVAGFDAAVAWPLVERGFAQWADPKRVPAKPITRKRSKRA